MSDKQKLVTIVQSQGKTLGISKEIINGAIKQLEISSTEFQVTKSVPRDELLKVWKLRAELHMQRGTPVQGYQSLLTEMSRTTEESLSIVSVKDAESQFSIFVTPAFDTLIGILFYPVQPIQEFIKKEKHKPQ